MPGTAADKKAKEIRVAMLYQIVNVKPLS